MKQKLIFGGFALLILFSACSKKNAPVPTPQPDTKPVTVGNTTTYPNGYIVKTIGISHINVGVDANYKLSIASLYGGGNRVILKAGSGIVMDNNIQGVGTIPDDFSAPDGLISYLDKEIDNGQLLDTASDGRVIKLTGFDKSKTGYNQLNLVMAKFMYPADYTGGYYSNLVYLDFKRPSGKKNADYGGAYVHDLFKGSIAVSAVEIAAPGNAYVVEDHTIGYGQAVFNNDKTYSITMTSLSYDFYANYSNTGGFPGFPTPPVIKLEWVNADKATFSNTDNYTYVAKFDNIKNGGNLNQIAEPGDSTSKVFLRVSGFDRSQFGFNALRLYPTNDGFYDGQLQILYGKKQTASPTVTDVKNIYAPTGLYGMDASPRWPHD